MSIKQMNMSWFEDELNKIRTRKKDFLDKMDKIIPWKKWTKIVEPVYPKGERGNKPYSIQTMLRIFVLQNLYSLADMAVMTEVIDSRAFSEFCGFDSPNQIPDGDTIGRFRNLLEQHRLQEKFFNQVLELLQAQGMILRKGTIIDSTIINAPSSTKNENKKRDPDAHQVKKGNEWRFGYKAHVGVDSDTRIVHSVVVTAANIHDVTVAEKLINGNEKTVHGDSGYLGIQKRVPHKMKFKINRRPSTYKKNSKRSIAQIKYREKQKSKVRAKVEHVFAVVKHMFGYRKTRYKGLYKQTQKVNMVFALSNLWLSTKISKST